ncbi:ComEC/Rec2 family competence protein [Streptomyces sp. NBC_01176]|uniref:ComEC/Rec2 family competence protein n=1 Tax=Streptomyces sp. NBC_01176 TaxID=2903760 RepID=UPI0038632623|nr:MBL fold metallo-hydrolase [Streptomyces sp. NBC_01176]
MTEVQAGLHIAPQSSVGVAEAVVLDVGHGNCAILRDGDTCAVVDARSGTLLLSELQRMGIRRIEHVVLSHSDEDHIQGALQLLPHHDFSIGKVWANSDSAKDSDLWDELLALIDHLDASGLLEAQIGISTAQRDRLGFGRVGISVLHPTPYEIGHGPGKAKGSRPRFTTNGLSVVLKVSLEGEPILLLPGDIDSPGLQRMLQRHPDISVHTVVYPHHGGGNGGGSHGGFVKSLGDASKPEMVVFSMGRDRFRNPVPEVVAAFGESFPSTRIACTQLSSYCHAGELPSVERKHLGKRAAAGLADGKCCAGTLTITVAEGEVKVHPEPGAHRDWIRGNVQAPMCSSVLPLPGQRPSSAAEE